MQKQSNLWTSSVDFLLSRYEAELARDPTCCGTESSRSNMIALWHSIRQIYGKAVARTVANLVYASTKRQSKTHVVSSNPYFVRIFLHDGSLTGRWVQRTIKDE